MANYGSNSLIIELTDSSDAFQDVSQHVRTFNGVDVENMTTESHGFGDSWVENLWTGMSKLADIVIEGFYSDTANTPAMLYARGASRRIKVTWGGSKTTIVPVIMAKFSRDPKLGELTHYKLTLKTSGAPTEA